MAQIVALPLAVEALYLDQEKVVHAATADFRRLPYTDGKRDFNPATPYLSRSIGFHPFEDQNLVLAPGVHLHWSLPTALNKAIGATLLHKWELERLQIEEVDQLWEHLIAEVWIKPINDDIASVVPPKDRLTAALGEQWSAWLVPIEALLSKPQGTSFPAVPDRWLIIRRTHGVITQKWMIESNYLHPVSDDVANTSINIPYASPLSKTPPFRYLGRKLPFDESWTMFDENRDQYLAYLTAMGYDPQSGAVGYREPTFAAFYPNSHTLFGFHDAESIAPPDGRLEYEVVGFYSNPSNNPLFFSVQNYLQQQIDTDGNWLVSDQSVLSLMEKYDPTTATLAKTTTDPAVVKQLITKFLRGKVRANAVTNKKLQAEFRALFLQQLVDSVKSELNWSLPLDINQLKEKKAEVLETLVTELSKQTYFHAQIRLDNALDRDVDFSQQVGIGHSTTSSLAAFVGLQHTDEKAIVEDQVESILLGSQLKSSLDVGPKFLEARHTKGFTAIPGSQAWSVRLESRETQKANAEQEAEYIQHTLPETIHVNPVNVAQQAYENARLEVESYQKQLFFDWHKYMQAAYPAEFSRRKLPNVDLARSYIEAEGMHKLEQKIKTAGQLRLAADSRGRIRAASAGPAANGFKSKAHHLAEAIQVLLAQIEQENAKPSLIDNNKLYVLRPVPGARFWEPNDPALTFVRPRNSTDVRGRQSPTEQEVAAHILSTEFNGQSVLTSTAINNISNAIQTLYSTNKAQKVVWRGNTFEPFLLEWEVELFPDDDGGNLSDPDQHFQTDFIGRHYQLKEMAADLEPLPGNKEFVKGANVYQGISYLTDSASLQIEKELATHLIQWLEDQVPRWYYKKQTVPTSDQNRSWLLEHLDGDDGLFVVARTEAQKSSIELPLPLADVSKTNGQRLSDWIAEQLASLIVWPEMLTDVDEKTGAMITAFEELAKWDLLSQRLGGFNQALLMRNQSRQLDIADPLGFAPYQSFAARVSGKVGKQKGVAPEVDSDFNPIRSGRLKVLKLRLVDRFGQAQDIVTPNLIPSEPLRVVQEERIAHEVQLMPRLSQPARLNFRWLSASLGEQEMNDSPASSPICGWVMSNHLDRSLLFYDQNGSALGSITLVPDAIWQAAPGSTTVGSIASIQNPYLKRVVQYLYLKQLDSQRRIARLQKEKPAEALPATYLENFMDAIDSAFENIEPENFARHLDIALLMGRPIAIVRAFLDLQLRGAPAFHQGWNNYLQELEGWPKTHDNFTKVAFPMRLGEHHQLNDGLLGYWEEEAEGLSETFYSQIADSNDEDQIITYLSPNAGINFDLSIDGPARSFIMLVDPRAKVHVTSGILPTKAIDIPEDQYKPALKNIEVTFLTAPILSPQRQLELPLPEEGGYEWSWLEKQKDAWREIPQTRIIGKDLLHEKIPVPTDVWQLLIDNNWLVENSDNPNIATAASKDRRTYELNGVAVFAPELVERLESFFDTYGENIGKINLQARFDEPQQFREGWLKLKRTS